METYFQISRCNKQFVLVTVLTSEMSAAYWESLSQTISALNVRNRRIVFDYLFRNGLKDRFYETFTDDNSTICISLKKSDASPYIVRAADSFFVKHKKYIEVSALTKRQKQLYLDV